MTSERVPARRSERGRTSLLSHRRLVDDGAHPDRWVLFLHGFLGAGRNWASLARGLVRARPDWGAVLVDLRLHGASSGFAPPHTVATSAADVNELERELGGTDSALVGHSFGGKIALAAARSCDPGLRQLWILDSTPDSGRTDAGADRLLSLLSALPERFDDRRTAVSAIRAGGFAPEVAEWAATNLERRSDGYRWRLDFTGLELLLADFYRVDLWSVVERPPRGVELLFVRASRDSILAPGAAERIERLEADGEPVRLLELEGTHWLNMSNPGGLLDLLASRLPRRSG